MRCTEGGVHLWAVLRFLRRLRLRVGSLERREQTSAQEQPVENLDAMAAARSHDNPLGGTSGYPPGYVKAYDEGRPRH
jgi:hypothetical protein